MLGGYIYAAWARGEDKGIKWRRHTSQIPCGAWLWLYLQPLAQERERERGNSCTVNKLAWRFFLSICAFSGGRQRAQFRAWGLDLRDELLLLLLPLLMLVGWKVGWGLCVHTSSYTVTHLNEEERIVILVITYPAVLHCIALHYTTHSLARQKYQQKEDLSIET